MNYFNVFNASYLLTSTSEPFKKWCYFLVYIYCMEVYFKHLYDAFNVKHVTQAEYLTLIGNLCCF